MRNPETGRDAIEGAIGRLAEKHSEHITAYGAGLEQRLTVMKLVQSKSFVQDRSRVFNSYPSCSC